VACFYQTKFVNVNFNFVMLIFNTINHYDSLSAFVQNPGARWIAKLFRACWAEGKCPRQEQNKDTTRKASSPGWKYVTTNAAWTQTRRGQTTWRLHFTPWRHFYCPEIGHESNKLDRAVFRNLIFSRGSRERWATFLSMAMSLMLATFLGFALVNTRAQFQ